MAKSKEEFIGLYERVFSLYKSVKFWLPYDDAEAIEHTLANLVLMDYRFLGEDKIDQNFVDANYERFKGFENKLASLDAKLDSVLAFDQLGNSGNLVSERCIHYTDKCQDWFVIAVKKDSGFAYGYVYDRNFPHCSEFGSIDVRGLQEKVYLELADDDAKTLGEALCMVDRKHFEWRFGTQKSWDDGRRL